MACKIYSKKEIEKTVIEVFNDKLGVDPDVIKSETDFVQDLGADSLDCVELIMELEHEFHLLIDDQRAEATRTIQDVVDLIADTLAAEGNKIED
jgi:acyl carrier protein